jgi:hypothetical protein
MSAYGGPVVVHALHTFLSLGGGYARYERVEAKASDGGIRRLDLRPAGGLFRARDDLPAADRGTADKGCVLVLVPAEAGGRAPGLRPLTVILADFGDTAGECLNRAYATGLARADAFIALVDGRTAAGGSFYANSRTHGDWETFILETLPFALSEAFPGRIDPERRLIAGFGMGGLGALRLGTLRPDVYQSVVAVSPMVVPDGGIGEAIADWNARGIPMIRSSYAAAFGLNTGEIPIEACLPGAGKSGARLEEWERGLGGWEERIGAYRNSGTRLRSVKIRLEDDAPAWSVKGAAFIRDLLAAARTQAILEPRPALARAGAA